MLLRHKQGKESPDPKTAAGTTSPATASFGSGAKEGTPPASASDSPSGGSSGGGTEMFVVMWERVLQSLMRHTLYPVSSSQQAQSGGGHGGAVGSSPGPAQAPVFESPEVEGSQSITVLTGP